MTDFTDILDTSLESGDPWTDDIAQAGAKNNLLAALEQSAGGDGSPYNHAAWHPYNGARVGDGVTGVIYDHAVDGNITSLETPDWVDGYEYMVFFNEVKSDALTGDFRIEIYNATSAAYGAAITVETAVATSSNLGGWVHFRSPRSVEKRHVLSSMVTKATGNTSIGLASTYQDYNATAQKRTRARFSIQSRNHAGGVYRMFRRRDLMAI